MWGSPLELSLVLTVAFSVLLVLHFLTSPKFENFCVIRLTGESLTISNCDVSDHLVNIVKELEIPNHWG
ncbi:MAG: triple gene block protein 3 [Beijing sediment betaflexivirus]|nr:MAG: triple gene block protein 3 [Beijing sediment betaflexivirus]